MILSGDWEGVHLRSYNVSSPVPSLHPGKYHPYLRFLPMVKRKPHAKEPRSHSNWQINDQTVTQITSKILLHTNSLQTKPTTQTPRNRVKPGRGNFTPPPHQITQPAWGFKDLQSKAYRINHDCRL